MLYAKTAQEQCEAIKFYKIRIYQTTCILPATRAYNIQCREVVGFLSPFFLGIDRLTALSSPYYCCDYEQIQDIISKLKMQWIGEDKKETSELAMLATASLERKIETLQEKNKEITNKYTGARGRESRLQKKVDAFHAHMATAIELASFVRHEYSAQRTITTREIKEKYLFIGKIYGIDTVPDAYVDIFRKSMPKELINWSGAPSQH